MQNEVNSIIDKFRFCMKTDFGVIDNLFIIR